MINRLLLMKRSALIATFILMLTLLQSAWAYSPIWSIEGWDANQLKKAGITVASWKHDQIGEDPPLNWVQVTYDTSKLPKGQNVLMTLVVTAKDGKAVFATRAEHKKGDANMLTIVFTVRQEDIINSNVQIIAPQLLSKVTKRAFGDSGFAGYSLSLSRIMELASKTPANKSSDSDDK